MQRTKWDWFVTWTCTPSARSASDVERRVQQMLATMRETWPRLYAGIVVEQGSRLGGWHAHGLVGGVGTHPDWVPRFMTAWRAHGDPHVVRYDPTQDPLTTDPHGRGVTGYLLKQWPTAEVQVVGKWVRHRPRVRRPSCTGEV